MKKCKEIRLPEETDLHLLGRLIYVLDSYRIHRYEDFTSINKSIKQLKFGKTFKKTWEEEITPILYKMSSLPMSLRKVKLLIRFRSVLGFITAAVFTVAFIILMARAREYGLILSVSAIILLTWYTGRPLIDYKIGKILNNYFEEHPEKFGILRSRLKLIVQNLIDEFSRLSKNMSEDVVPMLELYNIDYRGIKVIKKPTTFRKHFVVLPKNVKWTEPNHLRRLFISLRKIFGRRHADSTFIK
jgi:hypothetical protein